nr:uncharacterized protein LOC112295859 isoform X4 [Physcomitrium patens]|eukprot:XP_024403640.1 uncharacterized protein LOC112295859 isoform X4 [Physcomitrella patens]
MLITNPCGFGVPLVVLLIVLCNQLSCEMRRGSGLSVGFALVVASIPNSWRNLLSVPGLACVALLQCLELQMTVSKWT